MPLSRRSELRGRGTSVPTPDPAVPRALTGGAAMATRAHLGVSASLRLPARVPGAYTWSFTGLDF